MPDRAHTPPATAPLNPLKPPLTPTQVRRLEESRLKAKAQRQQHEAATAAATAASTGTTPATTASTTRTHRDARNAPPTPAPPSAHAAIHTTRRPAYVDYDLSAMTDTKGGFLAAHDDPHNRAMRNPADPPRPAHLSQQEWERHQLLTKLRAARAADPSLSVLREPSATCAECATPNVDAQLRAVFGVAVCRACQARLPERYALLTKTEVRADYLLTDPELRDTALLPHLSKPNPHKTGYADMMLYLRCQVEEYAFSDRKWGSAEALDAEFERRSEERKRKKEERFRGKLEELKKRTRVEAYKRQKRGGAAEFGQKVVGRGDRHEHEWGRVVSREGVGVRRCVECGMEVEEVEL